MIGFLPDSDGVDAPALGVVLGLTLVGNVPDPVGDAAPRSLCQWPCSSDQTLPSGGGPGGCGAGPAPGLGVAPGAIAVGLMADPDGVVAPGVILIGFVLDPNGLAAPEALCQWP